MSRKIFTVDAFADRPFSGNPAGVCLLEGPADPGWMQKIAGEMNLSETAFLYPEGHLFQLRWFTPTLEVALCGHATLASAHVLWELGRLAPEESVRFQTLSGILVARKNGSEIELDFPSKPVVVAPAPESLLDALGVKARFIGKNDFDYLVEVSSEDEVYDVKPDFGRLSKVAARGIIVTSRSGDICFDFVSRFFAPAAGVNEDPVTGSAHCALGPFWAERLKRNDFVAYQASARGGVVRVAVNGDRVLLGGKAVTVMRGELA